MTRWGKTLLAFTIGASSFIATETAPADAAGETIVAGTVVDAATGLGIGGLDVGVIEVVTPGVIAGFLNGAPTRPDGTFDVFIPDGVTLTGDIELMVIDQSDFYGSRYFLPVDVVPGGTTQTTVEMVRGGTVGGRLTRATGETLTDLCVMLTDLQGNRMLREDDPTNCSRPDGSYRTRAVPPGNYRASVSVPLGSSIESISNIPVTVTAATTTPLDIVVPDATPTAITGRVVDADTGERVAFAHVRAIVGDTFSGHFGAFEIDADAAGEFVLDVTGWANSPTPFHLVASDPRSLHVPNGPIDLFVQTGYTEPIEIALDPGGTIAGTMALEDGTPVDACVDVLDAASSVVASPCGSGQFFGPGLPAGQYSIRVPELDLTIPSYVAGPFTVELGGVTNVDIVVPRIRSMITGVVVDVDTGAPIPGVFVALRTPEGSETGIFDQPTDASGHFAIDVSNLLSGGRDFMVFAHDLFELRYYTSARHLVTVTTGSVPFVTIEMQKRTATLITGEVRDAVSGVPIEGIRISVTMPDGTSVEQLTAADGTFSIDAQPFVQFGTDFTIFADDPQGRYDSISPVSLTLQEGYAEPVGLVMQPRDVAGSMTATFARGSLRGVPAVNRRRAGSDVAVAFRVHDAGGTVVRDRSVVRSVRYRAASCATWAPRGPSRTAAGSNRLRVSRRGTMTFAWHTPRAPQCAVLDVMLTDGTALRARVALTPPPRPRRR